MAINFEHSDLLKSKADGMKLQLHYCDKRLIFCNFLSLAKLSNGKVLEPGCVTSGFCHLVRSVLLLQKKKPLKTEPQ
jgi:hypothetical protein